jgi:microcystin-dependent protein
MAVNLSPIGNAQQFFDNNGIPLSGGLLYTYQAGSSTPLQTFTDSSGSIANSNPMVLDAAGRLPSEVWLTYGFNYKFVLQTAVGVTLGTYDNIYGIIGVQSSGSGTTIPSGLISIWYGAIGSVPSGWYLCDGSNGTPDLRDRFVIGAGNTYAVAATGGATSKTLSTTEMPSHGHTFSATTGAMSANETHSHTTTNSYYTPDGSAGTFTRGGSANFTSNNAVNSASTAHTHDVSGTTASTGSGSSFSILNPYYALAYIMKS